jgi:hypothetical protein
VRAGRNWQRFERNLPIRSQRFHDVTSVTNRQKADLSTDSGSRSITGVTSAQEIGYQLAITTDFTDIHRDGPSAGQPGWIVALNGAPQAAKSSIAAALQDTSDRSWMNLGVDTNSQRQSDSGGKSMC